MSDWCQQCGASFPPREGEGICKEWHECQVRQLERELAECEKELIIWFSYVDPCDMYPEHDALWRERNKKVHPQNYKEWK